MLFKAKTNVLERVCEDRGGIAELFQRDLSFLQPKTYGCSQKGISEMGFRANTTKQTCINYVISSMRWLRWHDWQKPATIKQFIFLYECCII